jgi:hypothetical protein
MSDYPERITLDKRTHDSENAAFLWQKWLVTTQVLHDRPQYIRSDVAEAENQALRIRVGIALSDAEKLRKKVSELEAELAEMKKYMANFEPFKTWIEDDKTDSISGSPNCNFTNKDIEALEGQDE